MRSLAAALAVAAAALCAGLATPGASHAATAAHGAVGRAAGTHATRTDRITRLVSFARRQIGVPYVYGGSSRSAGYDCSGLVLAAYRSIGRALPHSSYAQMSMGRRVSWRGLRAGDLAFTNGGGHVMLVASPTTAISAPHTGARVRLVALSDFRGSFVTGRRLLR